MSWGRPLCPSQTIFNTINPSDQGRAVDRPHRQRRVRLDIKWALVAERCVLLAPARFVLDPTRGAFFSRKSLRAFSPARLARPNPTISSEVRPVSGWPQMPCLGAGRFGPRN
jgi:hypothetical protein